MLVSGVTRVGTWTLGVLGLGSAFGLGWISEPIQVPIWAVLALTFVPTRDFVEVSQTALDSLEQKISTEENK